MGYAIDEEVETPYGIYRVHVETDQDSYDLNPRQYDQLGIIVARHRDYAWPVEDSDSVTGNTILYALDDYNFRTVARWLRVCHGATVVLPLWNGSQGLSVGEATEDIEPHNTVGLIYDSPETREMTGAPLDSIADQLAGEAEEYAAWGRGDVFGYVVERKDNGDEDADDWTTVDSCWGFIGDNYAEQEALRALTDAIESKAGYYWEETNA